MIRLYGYFQSSAAYRARIALNLKELDYELVAVHLTKDGGHQFTEEYTRLNPQQLVPAIIDGDVTLTQSMAIMEYLEEAYPDHPILPADPAGRARVRSLSQVVACDIHPLNNLRVRKYIAEDLGLTADHGQTWQEHWINKGFAALREDGGRRRNIQSRGHADHGGYLPDPADVQRPPDQYGSLGLPQPAQDRGSVQRAARLRTGAPEEPAGRRLNRPVIHDLQA